MDFSQLGLAPAQLSACKSLGYNEPTPIQRQAIPVILSGRDVIGCAETGTGKTAAFFLPIIQKLSERSRPGLRVLVLAPTRELALQIQKNYGELNHAKANRSVIAIGGANIRTQISELRKGACVLIATPGRLLDLTERGSVNLSTIEVLVLDEADRMLDMGFLPAIRRIVSILPRDRQTLCYSATMEQSVAHIVHDYMSEPVRMALGSVLKPAESVQLKAYEVRPGEKLDVLRQLLFEETGQTLIFTRTKRGAERLAKELMREGFSAAVIHGNCSQSQRNKALSGFQEGRFRVLVATDIASRGLHIDEIAHVINYDVPNCRGFHRPRRPDESLPLLIDPVNVVGCLIRT